MSTAPDTSITTPSRIRSNTNDFKFLNAPSQTRNGLTARFTPRALLISSIQRIFNSYGMLQVMPSLKTHPLLTPSVAYFVLFGVVVVPLAFLKLSLFLY